MPRRNATSLIRLLLITILALVIVGYSSLQAYKLVSGPVIEIYTPLGGSVYHQTLIEIEGQASNIAYINMNDKQIFTNKDGYFKEKILLSPGYNIIRFDARDKFGSFTEEKLELVLKEY